MKLYLTHVGRMMIGNIPIGKILPHMPRYISIRHQANKYTKIEISPEGVINVNNLLAAIDADRFSVTEATQIATDHHMEIVGYLAVEI